MVAEHGVGVRIPSRLGCHAYKNSPHIYYWCYKSIVHDKANNANLTLSISVYGRLVIEVSAKREITNT